MSPKVFFLWVGFYLFPFTTFSQFLYFNTPASLGTGGTGVAQDDIWSVMHNPAGTANLREYGFAMGYHLPYYTQELSSQSVMTALPSRFGVVSIMLNHFGYQLYQENKIALSYATYLTPKLSAAFQLNWQNNHVSQSGSGSQFYSGLGLNYMPDESIVFGFYLSNPEKSNLTIQNEIIEIPSIFILGLSWKSSDIFTVSAEMEKQVGFNSLVKLGLEYNITNLIWIRAGVLGKPINYTFGLGFQMFKFRLDAALAHHQTLGISSSIGLSFQIPGKQ